MIKNSSDQGLYIMHCNIILIESTEFSEWSIWTTCDKTCGVGSKTRRRSCVKKDSDCDGITEETSTCKINKCPTGM